MCVTLVNAEKFLWNQVFFSSCLSLAAVPSHLEKSLLTAWRRNRLAFAIRVESFHDAITQHACLLAIFQQNIRVTWTPTLWCTSATVHSPWNHGKRKQIESLFFARRILYVTIKTCHMTNLNFGKVKRGDRYASDVSDFFEILFF